MKLTDKQIEIITLMQSGWELSSTKSEDGTRATITQKVQSNKGYTRQYVNSNTLSSLLRGSMIEASRDTGDAGLFIKYQLTEKGSAVK